MNEQAEKERLEKKRHTFIWLMSIFIIAGLAYFTILVYQAIQNPPDPLDQLNSTNQITSDSKATGNAITTQVVSADDPFVGSQDAAVKIVEFGDFQCPFCREAVGVIKALQTRFGDRVFIQFRDFPIVESHPEALSAAIAASCASEQGSEKFWAYHDRLFQFQDTLSKDVYIPIAQQVGLRVADFSTCLSTSATELEVTQDYEDGIRAGVRGTPTFFINGKKVSGVIPLELFASVVDTLLKE